MKNISLKLQDQVFIETEAILHHLRTSRNKYINEAVAFYNQHQKKKLIEQQLIKESNIVREDSMDILREFEQLEDEI